jgi:hypothetical protein
LDGANNDQHRSAGQSEHSTAHTFILRFFVTSMNLRIGCALVGFVLLALSLAAQTSEVSPAVTQVPIKFSSVAADERGKTLSGVVSITFSLYSSQQGGEPLWTETQNNVQLDPTGHYSVQLGITQKYRSTYILLSTGEACWLGVRIAEQAEQPRVLTYVIRVDDVLQINVSKEPEVSRTVPVRSDGKISLPLAGEVQARGETPCQLEKELATKLQSFISEPEVTVIVTEVRSQKSNSLGQVAPPGSCPPTNSIVQPGTSPEDQDLPVILPRLYPSIVHELSR